MPGPSWDRNPSQPLGFNPHSACLRFHGGPSHAATIEGDRSTCPCSTSCPENCRSPGALIALAPEGRDRPGGVLGPFPPGAGRFIEKIAQTCQPIVPIGIYEEAGSLCLHFGNPFRLPKAIHALVEERDQLVGQQVLTAIAGLLPAHLRRNNAAFQDSQYREPGKE